MSLGANNKSFEPVRTKNDWLNRDPEEVDKYNSDKYCTFVFTVNAYYQMFKGLEQLHKKENFEKIPKDLPIYFVAGENDPVGNFGKDVKDVYRKYKDGGIKDVKIKLFKDDRHEILNELDKQDVYASVYSWLKQHIK